MNTVLKGITIILLAYLAGEVISYFIGGLFPGSVLGMILLFALLQLGVINENTIKGVCEFILNNMMLLFVPVTVGLMASYKLLSDSWIGAIVAIAISTFIVFAVVGLLQQFLGRWRR
ncbi:MAG: CidA/LrgA family protein [Rikenellaceae bacterium]